MCDVVTTGVTMCDIVTTGETMCDVVTAGAMCDIYCHVYHVYSKMYYAKG